jgi:hypothetical protein
MHRSITSTVLALAVLAGATGPGTAAAAPGGQRPTLARTVIVSRIGGRVSVEQPSSNHFSRVAVPVVLRVGGSVDASGGVAGVEIATRSKKRWTARLSHGSAEVLQARSGETTFRLNGALDCASAASVVKRGPRRRVLWVSDRGGPFVSQGSYVSAAARGTEWITTDSCGQTIVKVLKGIVAVHNLVTNQTATVPTGHSYTGQPEAPAQTAAHFTWTNPEPITNGGEFAAISCSPSGFCGAVDNNGDVVTSPNAAGGPSTWTTTNLVSDIGLDSISCPTAQFCAATDGLSGDVLVSDNPAGGAGTWQTLTLPTNGVLEGVTCTSPSLCVAVDGGGDVIVSTNPSGGASTWKPASVDPGDALDDISCVGESLCVAVGAGLSTSTDPSGGASAWRTTSSITGVAVSCPTTALCVLAGDTGDVTTSTNPTGGPAAYKYVAGIDSLHPFQPGTGVSCVADGPCVIVGLSGDAVTTLDPTGPASAWSTKTIDANSGLAGVSCVSADLCVAVDQSGDAVIGTR